MKVGNAAIELVGFPRSHVLGFEFVAKSQGVIISREVGAVCTMLIEEGYAMKSFRISARSEVLALIRHIVKRQRQQIKILNECNTMGDTG